MVLFKNIFFIIKVHTFISNLFKKIIIIEKNNNIVNNNLILVFIQLLSVLNLNIIIKYLNYNYLYLIDNMYYYHTKDGIQSKITIGIIHNCIININLCCEQNINLYYEQNITKQILKYHICVPLYMIINNENIDIDDDDDIIFEILIFGQIKYKKYKIKDIIDKKLYEII